jgi:hypothetical protein
VKAVAAAAVTNREVSRDNFLLVMESILLNGDGRGSAKRMGICGYQATAVIPSRASGEWCGKQWVFADDSRGALASGGQNRWSNRQGELARFLPWSAVFRRLVLL